MDLAAATLVVGSGLLAGSVHVVTGADHLAALLPLSVHRGPRAWRLGANWGIGHSLGVVLIGGLAVALKERFDLTLVETWGERLVGGLLVLIGIVGARRASRLTLHAHAHEHDGTTHQHIHLHTRRDGHDAGEAHRPTAFTHGHTAFFAGSLHGIAGTAHLLGVLPALALPGFVASAVYLGAFALGTVAAMAAFAAVVGTGSRRWATGPGALRRLLYAASLATTATGLAWLALPFLEGSVL
jgi:hypothetical protein